MDLSFKAIAFELKYSSNQIDSVYALLDIVNKGDQKIPVFLLLSYKGYLPNDFIKYISKFEDSLEAPVNILFEQHKLASDDCHDDWDLIQYD